MINGNVSNLFCRALTFVVGIFAHALFFFFSSGKAFHHTAGRKVITFTVMLVCAFA